MCGCCTLRTLRTLRIQKPYINPKKRISRPRFKLYPILIAQLKAQDTQLRLEHPQYPFHSNRKSSFSLDHQALHLDLDSPDLRRKITGLVGGNAGGNNRARNTGGTAEGQLAGDVDIRNVLVLAKERQVQNDGERGGVCGEDHQLGGSTVQGLGGLCMILLDLTRKIKEVYEPLAPFLI